MKIMITGGHLAPAIALIEELRKKKDIKVIFVGRKFALDSEKTISLEYREIVENLKIPFINLMAGRLTRALTLKSVVNFFRIPTGFMSALSIVAGEKPDLIFSFGGFLALPVAFWGWVMRIPVYTHEQTANPGLANRIIAKFSKRIFVAFEETAKFFNPEKVVVCGNPIRKAVFEIVNKPFEIKKDRPVIYITGGSLGSHSINLHVKKILKELLADFIVIHQAGDTKEYHDYEDLMATRGLLPEELSDRYYLRKHFFVSEIGYVYSLTDLCIGRAGANTFFELLAKRIPAIFIPLPWSAGREQQKHAEVFARNGIGEIFHQVETSDKLLRLIRSTVADIDSYRKNFNKLNSLYKSNAAKILADAAYAKA
ncbi:MAG: UDP-N-acetylglucosamine--N-acetylmuramyl-(pentapeptide) pyrophosphoryl-undecaprenol N-acetylglucosamine transferase [Patescibacteria group bacterium]